MVTSGPLCSPPGKICLTGCEDTDLEKKMAGEHKTTKGELLLIHISPKIPTVHLFLSLPSL